ncbi:MAG: ABC transporter ATP-binding protein [Treponema sp.]|nr:ABC transporter ATP-binding protein [Treponema sp.]
MNLAQKLTAGLEKKYRVFTVLSPIVMLGEVLMETTIPLVMAKIVDVGIAREDAGYVVRLGLLMVLMSVFSLCCGAGCGRLSSLAAFGFSKNLRRNLFRKVQAFSFSTMDSFGTGSLVTRLTTDVTNIQNLYQNLIRSAVRSPLMLIFGTIMACFINIKLACIFFVVIPLLALFLTVIATKSYPRFKHMLERYDVLNNTVQENLVAIRVVKSFVRGDFECEKFDSVADLLRKAQVRAEKIVILNQPIMKLLVYSCIVCALWFGGNMILSGDMTTGELISFLSYINQTLMSLMMLSMMFIQFMMSRASVSRISEILDAQTESADSVAQISSSSAQPKELSGEIQFNDVYFSYTNDANNCVLSGINLHIHPGATVGIIGGTGSSKTTLVSLVPRLYDVLKGSVFVDGKDVRAYDLKELRQKIGVVLQKNTLFSGTIAENLRWGNEGASDEELKNACIASDADSFISNFPDKYETVLEQGGVNLSGGQKQRLCIARALVKKPEILILDDSTSAVDTATDMRIRTALRKNFSRTTKLIIAQRINSVQDADFIVVLDDGKINGIGTHEELLASNKIYQEVYESQMSEN